MPEAADLLDVTYSKFSDAVFAQVRQETFGEDLGQYGWTLRSELEGFLRGLQLTAGRRLLDVACGAGGPALFLARSSGCDVVGVDNNAMAIEAASRLAREGTLADRVAFRVADASVPLPFDDESFDSIVCLDAIVLLPARLPVLRDWRRLLRVGGRVVFTDPCVITGFVTAEEVSRRSMHANFVFSTPGENERLLRDSGLALVRSDDSTATMEQVAGAWHEARSRHEQELAKLEGPETFLELQGFFNATAHLAKERRMSRFTFLAERRSSDQVVGPRASHPPPSRRS